MNLDRVNGVVVDVETGGFDYSTTALLEVGMIALREGQPIARWHTRVIPYPGLVIEAQAAAVNGYTVDGWGGADERAVMTGVMDFLRWLQGSLDRKQLMWVGCNTTFDQAFMQAAMARHGLSGGFVACFGHRDLDVAKLAMIPYLQKAWNGIGLDVMRRELLGAEKRGVHSALQDCEDTLLCLHKLVERIEWKRQG